MTHLKNHTNTTLWTLCTNFDSLKNGIGMWKGRGFLTAAQRYIGARGKYHLFLEVQKNKGFIKARNPRNLWHYSFLHVLRNEGLLTYLIEIVRVNVGTACMCMLGEAGVQSQWINRQYFVLSCLVQIKKLKETCQPLVYGDFYIHFPSFPVSNIFSKLYFSDLQASRLGLCLRKATQIQTHTNP